jgi:hypothetical protein
LVAEHDGPDDFELGKAGQTVLHPYQCYHLIAPHGLPGETVVAAPGVRAPTTRKGALFISYSRHDAAWLSLLQTHLAPYVTAGAVVLWDDTTIRPGSDWKIELARALDHATVALFLVSPTFLASRFILEEEIRPLVGKARSDGTRILWLPLSASSYEETVFETIQAVMNPARPLDRMTKPQQHHALVNVCKVVKSAFGASGSDA